MLLRIALVAASVFAGWLIGTNVGVLVGLAWDNASGYDWVSNALLTIPLFGLAGMLAMLFIGLRLTRSR